MLNELDGATVLITGGTGSFGSTMARRLLECDVGQVRIFSRDEAKQDDLRRSLNDNRALFYIGDVRDRRVLKMPSVESTMFFTQLR